LSDWLLFITYAKSFKDDLAGTRKVYQKAFRFCKDKEEIARDWLKWEMLFGDASTILKCKDQIKRKVLLQPELKQVEPDKQAEPIKNKVTLFVKSLHRDTTEKQLVEIFSEFGLLQVRLPRDEASGNHRGIAFVDIDS